MLSHVVPMPADIAGPMGGPAIDGPNSETLDRCMIAIGRALECERDAVIFREGEASRKLYRVVDGAVRVCRFQKDGSRQIEAFYLPGDYFGFDIAGEARATAEATTGSTLLVAEPGMLRQVAGNDAVSRGMWRLAIDALRRSHDHSSVLCFRHGQERVTAFLGDMAARLGGISAIDLPMSRQDIADYLGLTIETVSRSFTDLAKARLIDMPRPRTVILRQAMRAQVAGNFQRAARPDHGIAAPFHFAN